MEIYDPFAWYWAVAGDQSRYWSTAFCAYVGPADLPEGAGVSNIETELALTQMLRGHALAGPVALPADVHAERDRRLAGGFDYGFGDERGVHRINTTVGDMVGWDEVTKFAQALITAGQPAHVISIATGSGLVQLTAMEWQGVLIAAAQFRQPIWGASFLLESMDTIPADFSNDAYWESV